MAWGMLSNENPGKNAAESRVRIIGPGDRSDLLDELTDVAAAEDFKDKPSLPGFM